MNLIHSALGFLRNLTVQEGGQDLVEYSLVLAMIALGSVVGMGSLATGINDVFSQVNSTLTANV